MALGLIHSVEMGLSVQEGTYSQPYPYDLNGEPMCSFIVT